MLPHILDLVASEIHTWLSEHGHGRYRAAQIRHWLYTGRAESFDAMTDLPKSLRQELSDSYRFWTTTIVRHQQADDGTEKLLLQLADGGRIECVLLRDGHRRTICISSQVGCAMGCVFCASGLNGVDRNLSTGEIVEQMLRLQRLLPAAERLSHIVVMGMGEPLANLDQVLAALDEARDPDGLGISPRRVTISTVGLPAAMKKLVELNPGYHLAVSVHAPNDALRNELVPVNRKTGLGEILQQADRYFESSGRRLTFEYVLLGGVNDQPQHARELAKRLGGRPALVNLIPYNPVDGLPYVSPAASSVRHFQQVLEASGLNVQVRQRKGDRINAACGQLRRMTIQH